MAVFTWKAAEAEGVVAAGDAEGLAGAHGVERVGVEGEVGLEVGRDDVDLEAVGLNGAAIDREGGIATVALTGGDGVLVLRGEGNRVAGGDRHELAGAP